MKPGSKILYALILGVGLIAGAVSAATPGRAFFVVPSGDPTYGQLQQLEDAGLLPTGDSKGSLTRFEVAQRIFKAEQKVREIVVAQNDMDLPPPPPDAGNNSSLPPPAPGEGTPATGGETTPAPAASSLWNDPQKIAEAEKALKSLQEAYDFELGLVKDQKSDLEGKVSKAESDQFDLWKSVKGISEYPSISIHGKGRAFGISQQYYGTYTGIAFPNPSTRSFNGYLDLEPTGSVSKELRWMAIFRVGTYALPIVGTAAGPGASMDYTIARWITADFNPDFMSTTFGDFYEAYTPLTLWNRNSLDLYYKPEMVARSDEYRKYESFFNQEPAWPFRGLKMGTALGWPDSSVLDTFKVSTFAHMIRSGFKDTGGGWYFINPPAFTDWIFGGSGELKGKKWYLSGTSWQITLETYGLALDEPLDSIQPGSPYSSTNAATWAHQYLIGSLNPTLKIGFGDDFYAGLQYEGAFSNYQDDKRNPNSVISDYALILSPFFQFGDSKITFNLLNVGPNFFSPLAQSRQDNINLTPNFTPGIGYLPGAGLFTPLLQNQFFLSNVPRPGAIFAYYDRTLDNTFPYGLATPNRQGFGSEINVETLKNKALKIRGAAYFLQEISGNLVVNVAGTGYTGLDSTASGAIPVRNFTYINMGPSIDLGPLMDLTTPVEIGTNVRYEQTTSAAGTLNSLGVWGGARVGFFQEWEMAGALGAQTYNGAEEGINGGPLARTSYLFDNSDLGKYSLFSASGSNYYVLFSTSFKVNRNSSLFVDYDLSWGNELPTAGPINGHLSNQFMGLTYEIIF